MFKSSEAGNMYWELHIDIIINFDVNGNVHSGMLNRACWTGIKAWKMDVTSSVRPRLSRNNNRRQQNLYLLSGDLTFDTLHVHLNMQGIFTVPHIICYFF